MIELPRNSYTSKHFDNEDGTFTLQAHSGHIHYKDGAGDYQDVDFTLEDMGTHWRRIKASYKLYINKTFGAEQLIRFDNRYEGANHSIFYTPHSVWWINADDMSERTKIVDAKVVTGVLNGRVVRYENAFGNGVHFEITLRRHGFKKEIVVDSKPNLGASPYTNWYVVPVFKWKGSGLKVKAANQDDWDENSLYEQDGLLEIRETTTGKKSYILQAYGTDSRLRNGRPRPRRKRLKVIFEKRGGALWQGKLITKEMVNQAVFPIRADTTTDYFINADAGDGYVGIEEAGSWAAAHDASSGNDTQSGLNTVWLYNSEDDGTYTISRAFFPMNTSALPDAAVISAATLYLYAESRDNEDNDGEDYHAVVETFQAGTSALVAGDFEDCGSDNGNAGRASQTPIEEGSSQVDISSLTLSAYNGFAFNATGLGWINKTGVTPIGLREGHDLLDSPASGGFNEIGYTANDAGTNDPYLRVTYTAGGVDYDIVAGSGTFSLTGTAVGVLKGSKLASAAGSYSLSGAAASFLKDSKISSAVGSYALTGATADLLKTSKILCEAGAFTLAGTAVNLLKGYEILPSSGAFALTGTAANLLKGYEIASSAGSYVLTGQDVDFLYDRIFGVDAGSYALTGSDVALNKGIIISADAGSYILTGSTTGLTATRIVEASSGNYTITGEAVSLEYGRIISALSGTFSITGQAASLLYDRLISLSAGSFILTGTAADLIYSSLTAYELTAAAGSFVLSGTALDLLYGRKISAQSGAYVLTGQQASLLFDRILGIGAGSFNLTGQPAGLLRGYAIDTIAGSYALTGQVASLLKDSVLSAETASYLLTGMGVALTYSAAPASNILLSIDDGNLYLKLDGLITQL